MLKSNYILQKGWKNNKKFPGIIKEHFLPLNSNIFQQQIMRGNKEQKRDIIKSFMFCFSNCKKLLISINIPIKIRASQKCIN